MCVCVCVCVCVCESERERETERENAFPFLHASSCSFVYSFDCFKKQSKLRIFIKENINKYLR